MFLDDKKALEVLADAISGDAKYGSTVAINAYRHIGAKEKLVALGKRLFERYKEGEESFQSDVFKAFASTQYDEGILECGVFYLSKVMGEDYGKDEYNWFHRNLMSGIEFLQLAKTGFPLVDIVRPVILKHICENKEKCKKLALLIAEYELGKKKERREGKCRKRNKKATKSSLMK